jgi:hypothetical protein
VEDQLTYLKSLKAYQEYLFDISNSDSMMILGVQINNLMNIIKTQPISNIVMLDVISKLKYEVDTIHISKGKVLSYIEFMRDNKLDQIL